MTVAEMARRAPLSRRFDLLAIYRSDLATAADCCPCILISAAVAANRTLAATPKPAMDYHHGGSPSNTQRGAAYSEPASNAGGLFASPQFLRSTHLETEQPLRT